MKTLKYDWFIADNADVPHCGVYEVESGNTVKEFPLEQGDAAKKYADKLNEQDQ